MKRFALYSLSAAVILLPLFLGLACQVETPAAPGDFPTALRTIVAGNPSFTPTDTRTETPTPTPTATCTETPTPTPTP